ncbi:unnamed protein product [Allacma fusca]|uniref:non-specific serine/threonine protein kinase n=1 Tax=Allacma fusca TaxID=39272 RepID=A0A8J2JN75_9HEXA|nr:unnamed protein product [Allacma fusca]
MFVAYNNLECIDAQIDHTTDRIIIGFLIVGITRSCDHELWQYSDNGTITVSNRPSYRSGIIPVGVVESEPEDGQRWLEMENHLYETESINETVNNTPSINSILVEETTTNMVTIYYAMEFYNRFVITDTAAVFTTVDGDSQEKIEFSAGPATNPETSKRNWKCRNPNDAMILIGKAAKALDYVHGLGYVHNDINSGNFVVTLKGQVLLIDLDNVEFMEGEDTKIISDHRCTYAYAAPEVLKYKKIIKFSDYWALRATMYEFFFFNFLMNQKDEKIETYIKLGKDAIEIDIKIQEIPNADVRQVLRNLLDTRATKKYSCHCRKHKSTWPRICKLPPGKI